MPEPERIFLGLGSNLGERERNIREALKRIAALRGTEVVRVSRLIETEPWGVTDQPPFINGAAEVRTSLEPLELLAAVKQIEQDLGRTDTYRWGPRVIDLDLLLFGDRVVKDDRLNLPHPHILDRPFVLEPLREIAPEVVEELRRAPVPLRGAGPDRQ
jgi:2-amino-4-hydroxy-6-hydroxymethyldihydropteridine diphosphokinase